MKKLIFAFIAGLSVSASAMAFQCSYDVMANGRVIDVITVGSDISPAQACQKANVACVGMLRSRYSHVRGAFCLESRRGGGWNPAPIPRPIPRPGPQYVTRTCNARLMERGYYGGDYQVQSFFATATGYAGSGVQRRACDEALRECQFSARFNQYCVVNR